MIDDRESKWQWVVAEIEKLKAMEARIKRLEGFAESRIVNKQGTDAHSKYTGIPSDEGRPPIDEMGK